MNINYNQSQKIRKIERRLKKDNLLKSKYLVLKLQCDCSGFGLFTYYINFIGEIEYAVFHNMIPVIDMQTYRNSMHREGEVGKINTWERFFEQPCNIGLEEAMKSHSARYFWKDFPEHRPNDSLDFLCNDDLLSYYHRIAKKYVRINKQLKEQYDATYEEIIGDKHCVGVLARGTDYSDFKPYANPIQPTFEQLAEKVDECLKQYECTHVFVATEDASMLRMFKNRYGEQLLYIEQDRFENVNSYLYENSNFKKTDNIELTVKYLEAIYLLSRCDGIVGGRTSGSVGACVMADNYRFRHILTYGRYGIDDKILNRVSI